MKTKRAKYIAFIIVGVLTLPSCHDNFLTEDPSGFIAPESFYQTEEDAIAAVTHVYDGITNRSHSYNRRLHWILAYPADEASGRGGQRAPLDVYTYDSSHPFFEGIWSQHYENINRANSVIRRIPDTEMDENLRNRLLGEVHFLRALWYFDIVRLWGAAPLELEETTSLSDLDTPESSVSEIYQQVISDLEFAEANLPISQEQEGRTTKGAALALLTRVYLTKATSEASESDDYENSVNYARQVEDLGVYHLVENYADLFEEETENGPEHIFSGQSNRISVAEQSHGLFWSPQGTAYTNFPERGTSWIWAEHDFFESFPDGDYRKEVTFVTEAPSLETGEMIPWQEFNFPHPHIDKHITPKGGDPTLSSFGGNALIIRYADVLLMKAEALNELNGGPNQEALDAINKVRLRARNGDPTATPQDVGSGLSQEAFRDTVLQERQWELSYEYVRWFDLVRTGRLVEVMNEKYPNLPVEEKHFKFPKPASELRANPNLQQNPGW